MSTPSQTTAGGKLVEMAWDPITRIVGSLGIYTKIDFEKREVAECYSTSSIFRGYSIFMKGKDPRDAHFITSRICGICGDNHATCSVLRAEHGLRRQAAARSASGSSTSAKRPSTCSTTTSSRRTWSASISARRWCARPTPASGTRRRTHRGAARRRSRLPHHRRHHEVAQSHSRASSTAKRCIMSRLTREMFCLMEGRHVHPSTLYPGGVGTWRPFSCSPTTCPPDEVRRVHEAASCRCTTTSSTSSTRRCRATRKSASAASCSAAGAAFQNPEVCNFRYEDMTDWGRAMFVTPGVVVDGKLVTNDLVEINLGIRILLGSSFYEDWEDQKMFVTHDPLGNPVDRAIPGTSTPFPRPQKRDFDDNYSWVMSPRWFDGKDYLPLDTGGGPIARLWSTALVGPRRHRLREGHRHSVRSTCRRPRSSRRCRSSGRFRSGATPSSATARAPTSRRTRRPARCTS